MIKKIIFIFLTVVAFNILSVHHADAQQRTLPPEPPQEQYFKAEVQKIISEEHTQAAGLTNFSQTLQLKLLDGENKGKIIQIEHNGVIKKSGSQKLDAGNRVIVVQTTLPDKTTYLIIDRYRLDSVVYILLGFFLLVIIVAGKKGVGSIFGMVFSIFVILQFIVPQILQGRDPLLISIVGSLVIMVITLYLAHGINKKTTVALAATFLSLLITGSLSYFFVEVTNLTGLGSEDAYLLQFGQSYINLKGLLLGGIIIGTLGVLDDITTSQSAAVFELAKANKKLEFMDLVMRGYTIGKEHIASLVNTLVLAYSGASLSLFILFVLNPSNQPYWVILNNQMIIEEMIRTLAGSIGLVLAVPIATVIAAGVVTKKS